MTTRLGALIWGGLWQLAAVKVSPTGPLYSLTRWQLDCFFEHVAAVGILSGGTVAQVHDITSSSSVTTLPFQDTFVNPLLVAFFEYTAAF